MDMPPPDAKTRAGRNRKAATTSRLVEAWIHRHRGLTTAFAAARDLEKRVLDTLLGFCQRFQNFQLRRFGVARSVAVVAKGGRNGTEDDVR